MIDIKEYTNPDGWNVADVDISKEEWISLFGNEDIIKPQWLECILRFYGEPGHKSSCFLIGKKYNANPQAINATITNCCRAVQ